MNVLLAWFFKLVLAAAALILAASLLLALLAVLVVSSLWSLLHGRKPQVAVLWTRYRDLTRGMTQARSWAAGRQAHPGRGTPADVVDVPVKEVREDLHRLPHSD
jgi:hypothetical protein